MHACRRRRSRPPNRCVFVVHVHGRAWGSLDRGTKYSRKRCWPPHLTTRGVHHTPTPSSTTQQKRVRSDSFCHSHHSHTSTLPHLHYSPRSLAGRTSSASCSTRLRRTAASPWPARAAQRRPARSSCFSLLRRRWSSLLCCRGRQEGPTIEKTHIRVRARGAAEARAWRARRRRRA
jgi:hypothetical protein